MGMWMDTARRLNEARRTGAVLDSFPGPIPPDLPSAYELQEEVIADVGQPIAGWKLGLIERRHREAYAAERLIGPVLSTCVYRARDGIEVEVPILGGSNAIEAELALLIDWNPQIERCPASDRLHLFCAIEVTSSPVRNVAELGPGAVIGDRGGNGAIVIGPSLGTWNDLIRAPVETSVEVDGHHVGTGGSENVPGGVADSLAVLIHHLAGRGRSLAQGEWVLTGATTGAHSISPGQRAVAIFPPFGSIAVRAV